MHSPSPVVDVDGKHEMISCGWSNPNPWKTPREFSEEELEKIIENMISQHVKDMSNCIFNLHVPPIDSGLDTCPKLDENLARVRWWTTSNDSGRELRCP
jgi:Icc-related predicted phosphoesterase